MPKLLSGAGRQLLSIFINGEKIPMEALQVSALTNVRIEDSSKSCKVRLRALPASISTFTIFYGRQLIACGGSLLSSINRSTVDALLNEAAILVDDRNELFTHDHEWLPNNNRPRAKAKSPKLKEICLQVSSELGARVPPAEHNKLGLKRSDVLDLTQLHVDRFQGMRSGAVTVRRKINRYFVNIGATPRQICFSLSDPDKVEEFVPDLYHSSYLDPLLDALGWELDLLLHQIPPAAFPTLHYGRYLATHLLHCEYGRAPDAALVINSDTDTSPDTYDWT